MRAVLQRVSRASVAVEGQVVGTINRGLLALIGIHRDDTTDDGDWLARKIIQTRIFPDEAGKMNRSIIDAGGQLLVVSQFTLYGDASTGNRPSFTDAMPGDVARAFFEDWVGRLEQLSPLPVEQGVFAATMAVSLVNDGPVTLLIDSAQRRNCTAAT